MQVCKKVIKMKPEIKVAIITPYLTEVFEQREMSKEEFEFQTTIAGYKSGMLLTEKAIETDFFLVKPWMPKGYSNNASTRKHFLATIQDKPDLVIAGSSPDGELEVGTVMGSGLLVARYSMFFGGPSLYTGLMPQDMGYALDIKKDPEVVQRMLKDDCVLEAILKQSVKGMSEAVEKFNKGTTPDLLVTAYLAQVFKGD